ncbi:MAG: putative ABC transporter substrate-binding protein YesO [Syntrophomonadaceae bacterium]|nr:putative ABC transporter substrate-binding protein YesO [Bacillota bacterium]
MKNNTTKVIIGLALVLVVVLGVWLIAGRPPVEEPVAEVPVATPVEDPKEEERPDVQQPPQPVEINAVWWGSAARHELYNKIIDEFQKEYEHITVVREPSSWADYWTKLAVVSAGGTAPDFMGMHVQFAKDYIRRGVLEPLDAFVDEEIIDISNLSQAALDSGVVDGKIYMIPMGLTLQSVLINTDMLIDLGIDVPVFDWTWDEYRELASATRNALDDAGQRDSWFSGDFSGAFMFFRYWVRQNGREIYDKDGNINLTTEDVATWFTMWKELRDNRLIPDAATTAEFTGVTLEQSMFVLGRTAANIIPANQYTLFKGALPEPELIMVRNPSKIDGQVGEYVEGAHFAIAATATPERKRAAAALINFWVNSEASINLFRLDQGVPANTKMVEFLRPLLDANQNKILDFVELTSAIARPTIHAPAGAVEVNSLFERLAEEVRFEVKSSEDAAVAFVAEAQSIVEAQR